MIQRCAVHGWRRALTGGLCWDCLHQLPELAFTLLCQRSEAAQRNIRRALGLRATVSAEAMRAAAMEAEVGV